MNRFNYLTIEIKTIIVYFYLRRRAHKKEEYLIDFQLFDKI